VEIVTPSEGWTIACIVEDCALMVLELFNLLLLVELEQENSTINIVGSAAAPLGWVVCSEDLVGLGLDDCESWSLAIALRVES
jgi:hypothetical protein